DGLARLPLHPPPPPTPPPQHSWNPRAFPLAHCRYGRCILYPPGPLSARPVARAPRPADHLDGRVTGALPSLPPRPRPLTCSTHCRGPRHPHRRHPPPPSEPLPCPLARPANLALDSLPSTRARPLP